VLFGGEVFAPDDVRRLMQFMPNARFSNVYGPAEVNQCMFFNFDRLDDPMSEIPIGRAWDHTALAVNDGELLVKTDTAMSCYWNRPDLTEQAFVKGPDGANDWYATGDLVEERDNGIYVFLGRRDNQVKVRGQRVELEAVDLALSQLPAVADAVAIVATGPDGLPVIHGLVTTQPGAPELGSRALSQLRGVLPAHAVPHRIVTVESLPVTANGKIDRPAATKMIEMDA
jgi:acyl-coenzyme A synthetase/AMP-(fatty) acid ligase